MPESICINEIKMECKAFSMSTFGWTFLGLILWFLLEDDYNLQCNPTLWAPLKKDIHCNVDTACGPKCILRILNNPKIRPPL